MNEKEIYESTKKMTFTIELVNWIFYLVSFIVCLHILLQLFYDGTDRKFWLTVTSSASVILAMIQLGFVAYAHKIINKLKNK